MELVPLYKTVPAGRGIRYRTKDSQEIADLINDYYKDELFYNQKPAQVDGEGLHFTSDQPRPRTGDWVIVSEEGSISICSVEHFTKEYLPPPGRAF